MSFQWDIDFEVSKIISIKPLFNSTLFILKKRIILYFLFSKKIIGEKIMEAFFEKFFFVSTELTKMQDFVLFTQNVHAASKFKEENCEIDKFLSTLNEKNFNEELSYDERRIFFTNTALQQNAVFNAMFNLHHKGKENIKRTDDLFVQSAEVLERQKKHYEELRKLTSEKYLIQRKIDSIIEKLYY